VAATFLTSGCSGNGQQDSMRTPVTNATATIVPIANISNAPYTQAFEQGFGHNANASRLFNNATALWNNDQYADAADVLKKAETQYALATADYRGMAGYARNDSEMAFARDLENFTINMDEATSKYILSINASISGNDIDALADFNEGQALADQGMASLNSSVEIMPEGPS